MIVLQGLEAFPGSTPPVSVALGTFDGLHRGHRAIIEALLTTAEAAEGWAVVVTFDPHPVAVIAPGAEPLLLSTIDERVELVRAAGAHALVIARFDETVRQMDAQAWLELLAARLHPKTIAASSTHTFGRNREGTAGMLQAWTAARGIEAVIVPPVRDGGTIISSSAIRQRLRAGEVGAAARWLGRWYSARGPVVPGDRRGRQIGVPTANMEIPASKLLPARGVYAAFASTNRRTFEAAVNIGVRPTFDGERLRVEAHLLDADIDLYGQTVEVAFVDRLREERKFPSVDALRDQLAMDIRDARVRLADRTPVM
jgi:riboflavin kinase/FMN adenylyltransferase